MKCYLRRLMAMILVCGVCWGGYAVIAAFFKEPPPEPPTAELSVSELRREAEEERRRLWAALRPLRSEIDRIGSGDFDSSETQKKLIPLLARIVASEMNYRANDPVPPESDEK